MFDNYKINSFNWQWTKNNFHDSEPIVNLYPVGIQEEIYFYLLLYKKKKKNIFLTSILY